ncbi:hypothetical protein BRADI_1g05827v3 [Brachypodium distachyon]|uniref:Bifunctional inhibitor/plant lipid transfer protein/seed storage helical domain-containing protein n=2 Tax=Brachypodium distachyon TaxID=15368 RepID=A0A2K2DI75_BRADI|nr:hypothetical protein BRADI_1g05827v3 [Brachypodium distachyon]
MAAALLACRCAAQAPAPAPSSGIVSGSGCMPELVSLSPCMGYMSGNATAPGPGTACCSAVSGVLASSPRCLCAVLGGTAATLGVALDGARATQLPGACRVQAPPASQCNALGVPMPSPANPAAAGSTPATPSDPNVPPAAQYSGGNIDEAGRTLAFAVGVAAVALLHGVAA